MARAKSRTVFQKNRDYYHYVTPEMWKWFFEEVLRGEILRIGVMAGGRPARKIAQALMDLERLARGLCPVEIDLVFVCVEDGRTEEGCSYYNMHNRFYWECVKYKSAVREPCELGGDWINAYITSAERWYRESTPNLFFGYGDPSNEEWRERIGFEKQIRKLRRLGANDKPFHMVIGLPWGTWINDYVRSMCGEIIQVDDSGKPIKDEWGKKQLVGVEPPTSNRYGHKTLWSNGLLLGLHPVFACGGAVGCQALAGADVIEKLIAAAMNTHNNGGEVELIYARLESLGIGPLTMDDPRLRSHEGPARRIAKWPFPRKSSRLSMESLDEEVRRKLYRDCVEGLSKLLKPSIWGRLDNSIYGIGGFIAERVYVLWHATHSQAVPS